MYPSCNRVYPGAHALMLLPCRAALERRLSDGLAFLDKCRLLAKVDGDGVEQLTYLHAQHATKVPQRCRSGAPALSALGLCSGPCSTLCSALREGVGGAWGGWGWGGGGGGGGGGGLPWPQRPVRGCGVAVRRAKKATIPRRFDTRLEFLEPVHLNIDPFHLRMCMEASTSLATSAGAVALLLPRAPTKPPPALPASSLQPKLVRRPPRGLVREHPRLVAAADPPLSNDARNSRGSTRGDSRSASDGPALGRVEEGLEEGESWREVSGESSSEVHGHGHGAFTESRHHRRHLVGQLGGVVGRIGRGLGHAQRTVLREAAGLLPSGRRRQSAESNEPLREESSLNGGRGSLGGSLGSDWGDVEEADQFTRTVAVVCREVSVSLLSSLNHSPTAVAKLQIISPSTHAFSLAAESTPATGMRASIDLQLQATHTHTHTRICTHIHTHTYTALRHHGDLPHTYIYVCVCRPRTSTAPWGYGSPCSSRRKSHSSCASRRAPSWARRPPR